MRSWRKGTGIRLAITVWLVSSIHATTNVVRETYLAISLGGYGTLSVERYIGLHPDLFMIPGRGGYINSNPGASMLGAVAYAVVHPVIQLAVQVRPSIAAPKPPAKYDDPRPNRTKFMNASRARGLDIVLGLAALGIAVVLMAPLAALSAVLVYRSISERLQDERAGLWWALVYAFATPILFRTAFLNQNVILAHCVLGAWLALTGFRGGSAPQDRPRRLLTAAGMLLGLGLVCDYSAAPFIVVFAAWLAAHGWRSGGMVGALGMILPYAVGVALPVALLLGYQWAAFGHPLYPAQRYMPETEHSVKGWLGFTAPTADLFWRNLFDLRYGLIAFCPLLAAAFAAPFIRKEPGEPSASELWLIFASLAGLHLFSSANQYANLQWNTGVRYMVPATPLLFFAAVPVLRKIGRIPRTALVGASFVISLAVTMTREDVPTALRMIATDGPTLPVLIVLRKMESGYGSLSMPWFAIWIVYLILAVLLWIVWRGHRRAAAAANA